MKKNHQNSPDALSPEEMFEQLLETSPVYVFFKDKNARAIRLSRNYEKMLGIPLEKLLGKNMNELFPSDLAKTMVAETFASCEREKPSLSKKS